MYWLFKEELLPHLVLLHLLSLAAPLALIIREITVIAVRHLFVFFYPYNPDGNTTEQTTSNTPEKKIQNREQLQTDARFVHENITVYMLLDSNQPFDQREWDTAS